MTTQVQQQSVAILTSVLIRHKREDESQRWPRKRGQSSGPGDYSRIRDVASRGDCTVLHGGHLCALIPRSGPGAEGRSDAWPHTPLTGLCASAIHCPS